MATSVLIAKLLGPVLLVAAIPMLVSPKDLNEVARGFLQDRVMIYVTGVLALVGGLAIVNNHNLWVADWRVAITLFGWAMAVGGAARVALPRVVKAVGGEMLGNPTLTRAAGVVWALVGAYVTYKGYF